MESYNQFCPLAQAAQLLCQRWTLLIVRELLAGSSRFSEIQKGVPTMSPTLLSTRLKQLTQAGVVEANDPGGGSVYKLTAAGEELRPVIEMLGAWGHRWARSNLSGEDLDAGLLMWDIRRSVDPSMFPAHRVVVEFNYTDAPQGAGQWWLVSENNDVDLCLNDHGYDVDVVITSSLKAMTEVWICDQRFDDAVKNGDIKVIGNPELSNNLQDWLRTSPLSRLGTTDQLPQLEWQVE